MQLAVLHALQSVPVLHPDCAMWWSAVVGSCCRHLAQERQSLFAASSMPLLHSIL